MSKKKFPVEVIDAACADYVGYDDSLGDVALAYGISSSTLARGLAERGERQLKKYKTTNEYEMINILRAHGITHASQLKEAISPESEGTVA